MPRESSVPVKIFYPRHSLRQLVQLLNERLAGVAAALPLKRALLFGSWVRGRATAFSDIDLLIVYEDPPRDDAFKTVWRCLDLRGVEAHVYSEKEARILEPTIREMTRGGIPLSVP